jgi:hypothetical protein
MEGRRPKLILYPSRNVAPKPGLTPQDFLTYASYRGSATSGYYAKLTVVRKTDGRLLFPFEGEIVLADIAKPEL